MDPSFGMEGKTGKEQAGLSCFTPVCSFLCIRLYLIRDAGHAFRFLIDSEPHFSKLLHNSV